jgi:hypothetical protein
MKSGPAESDIGAVNSESTRRATACGPAFAGVLPIPLFLLHGASGPYDDIAIFGGVGFVVAALVFLSWRAGRERKRRERGRRRRR